MTTQQQTERDEALIAEARKNLENTAAGINGICAEVLRLERSGWTPPTKPDRYELDAYDAGLMPDYGSKTDWWWAYIRAELGRAHDFYQAQIDGLASPVAEPAKPDRYVEIWQEAFKAWDGLYCANDRAAAAVLRRHFEPSVEVLKAAGKVESITNSCAKNTFCSSARTLADHILKGDQ